MTTNTNPADAIIAAFAELRARYADAPAVVEWMLAGDVEAILLGRSWLAEVDELDRRLGALVDDSLKLYASCGLLEVSDATCIVDGEADPREFSTAIVITPEIVQRWAPVSIRREIKGNEGYIDRLPQWVDEGKMDHETADREVARFIAENERLTAELAVFEGAR